jgi:FADH2 O2-dependent halogenase
MSAQCFQVVVVGSGFAGSLMAMIAHRLGLSTALVERGRHPRFVIGESSTPLTNLLLEELATDYDLPFVRPLCKWGTWQAQTPHLACGLKRGFTFYHHEFGQPFRRDPERQRQLLVGASPREEIADTHWYRPDFDQYLVQQAQALGVTFWDEAELTSAVEGTDRMRLSGKRAGQTLELDAEFVIDASGPRGFLHRSLGLPAKSFATLPPTQALFSHFTGVGPLPGCFCAEAEGLPPYPVEQAAVHHIFPGGWIWVLKFNNGRTSAGVAAIDSLANALNFASGEPAWERLLSRLPSLAEIFAPARAVLPFIHQPRVAFQSGRVTGRHWALLPSAAGVIDPLLSTGFPLTLLGVARIARLLRSHWRRPAFAPGLVDYAALTTLELETTARLVGALYATMNRFELFKELGLLYFAAASFSETARRLGKPQLADSFLLSRHPVFSRQLRRLCEAAARPLSPEEARELERDIRDAIRPLDVAGLTNPSRRSWYPALVSDLLSAAPKLGVDEKEIVSMLAKCGIKISNEQAVSAKTVRASEP